MKINTYGEFSEYQPAAGESVVLHDSRFIASRIDGKGSTAPGRKLQAIQGKTADVDAEIARLGLTVPTAEQRRFASIPDAQLAAQQAKTDQAKAALDAEAARRVAAREA